MRLFVIFTIRPEAPDTIEARVLFDAQDLDLLAFLGDARLGSVSTNLAGTEAVRDGNTFRVSRLTGIGLPPDKIPLTVENFRFHLGGTRCDGAGGMDYVDRGFRVEFRAGICHRRPCLSSIPGGSDPCANEGEKQDFVFWRANGGAYGDSNNWEPQRVPGTQDTAVFDRDAADPVTIATATTRRLQFERGSATFRGGMLELTASSLTTGLRSLEIGSDGGAFLDLENLTLNTVHSLVGANQNSVGFVELTGPAAVWNNAGRLSVGFEAGGDAGLGSGLSIVDGASVTSAESRIGDGPGGVGGVLVGIDRQATQQSQALSTWTTGNLAVGFQGTGTLDIVDGAVSSDEAVVIGSEVNSRGDVTLAGENNLANWTMDGSLFVGLGGIGTLSVRDNSSVVVSEDAFVGGTTDTSCGAVDVVGSSMEIGRLLVVGSGSQGLVRVLNDASIAGSLVCADALIGTFGDQLSELRLAGPTTGIAADSIVLGVVTEENEPEPFGTLTLRDGAIALADEVIVNAGSVIQGIGGIAGNVTNNGGILAPGGTGFSIESDCAIEDLEPKRSDAFGAQDPEPKQSDAFGVLEIDGNLSMTGGSVIATIGGSGAGEFSQLVVTGNASFIDTTITLSFDDGFSPTTGDEFSAIVVDGTLTTENLRIEIEGADPDFAFDLSEVDGRLMVMTTVGAEPSSGGGCAAARVDAEPGFGPDDFLVALSLTVLFALRRRRRSSRKPT